MPTTRGKHLNPALKKYIEDARSKGHSDDQIKKDMVSGGWDAMMVDEGLKHKDGDLEVPPPPPAFSGQNLSATPAAAAASGTDSAVKVVAMKTTAGLEYLILFLSLWVAAMALGALLHSTVDLMFGQSSWYTEAVSFAAAALIVSLPIFSWLFIKLKKEEVAKPEIRRDQNRKGAVQLTLLVTFLIGLFKLIFYVYQLLNAGSPDAFGGEGIGVVGNLLHTVITVGIAGSIFVYYWIDEHKQT